MPHSLCSVWIHSIFTTKIREFLISDKIEDEVYAHITEQMELAGCSPEIINGMPDHIHMLFQLSAKISIADLLKQIKGNTPHWINENNLIDGKFEWQTGYAAYSVSESELQTVYYYIKNQKLHHSTGKLEMKYEYINP
jgi:putative transposase